MGKALSAKSLFRATRQKTALESADDAGLFDELPEGRAPEDERRSDDFYPTGQPEAIRALLSREKATLKDRRSVWEPAVGDGALAREMKAFGFQVRGSDVVDRGWPETEVRSFYDYEHSLAPVIITNPPYCEINARDGHGRWLRHTLEIPGWSYCAFLLSWDWPAARANGLGDLLDNHPFSYCYLMRWKLDFTGAGSPPQRNAWFVWDKNWTQPEPAFRWLDRIDGRQSEFKWGTS